MRKLFFFLTSIIILAVAQSTAQTVTFSKPRGLYSAAISLTLTSDISVATIKYTTDGTLPSATVGTTYTSAITINTTTVVRAIAIKGAVTTNVFTNTFIFPNKVVLQPANVAGWPNNTYNLGNGPSTAVHDYEMDPDIVNNPAYSSQIVTGLQAIPTLSMVMDKTAFWEMYDGTDIERQASVEIIYPNSLPSEQFDIGIEAHSWLRLKRSMRLDFSGQEYTTKLLKNAPLNGSSAKENFKDTKIVLRAGNNDAWSRNWNTSGTTFTRDEWYRASQIAMDGYGSHGNFVHLYVNGLYWGLYNAAERPDEGFDAAYFGGNPIDWLSINQDGTRFGDNTRYEYLTQTIVGKDISVPANYDELKQYLKVSDFSDYMILCWMPGMADWPDNNWFGANRNDPPQPFFYLAWDAEWSWTDLHGANNGAWVYPDFRRDTIDGSTIPKIWHAARKNPDFMQLFADRVYKHCFNAGAMTDASSRARWTTLNNYISTAVIAESARWGDAVNPAVPRTKNDHWLPEVNRIDALMNGNVQRFITALRAEGYYPTINPPNFNQEEGHVLKGFQLIMTNPNAVGTIYYTTNGTDPRLPGGGLSPDAVIYSSAITINNHLTIKARVKNENEWSAIHEGLYTIYNLKLNEFLANNTANIKDEKGDYEDWIEIYNNSPRAIDMGGMYFSTSYSNPKQWQIPVTNSLLTTIQPYSFLLFWADNELTEGFLHTNFKLGTASGKIALSMTSGANTVFLDSLAYGAQTTNISRGRYPDGSSMFQNFSVPTPLEPNQVLQTGLFINEFLASNVNNITDDIGQHEDWIEIYNSNPTPVNIGGFYITDSLGAPNLYQIPTNAPAATTIPANGFLLLWADDDESQGPLHLGIKLSNSGEQIGLVQKLGSTNKFLDSLSFGAQLPDISRGRYPDGTSSFNQFGSPTPGQPNILGLIAGLDINEFLVSNTSGITDEFGEKDDWIEIYNKGTDTVNLGGLYLTNNLANPTLYQIPTSNLQATKIAPGEFKKLWADNQPVQGVLHLGFTLISNGSIGLAQNFNGIVSLDSLSYSGLAPNKSIGRFPDGTEFKMTFNSPTPGSSNTLPLIIGLYINEFLASNNGDTTDNVGDSDDWIEFYNSTNNTIDLGGLFITDDLTNPRKYQIPANDFSQSHISAQGFILLWADEEPTEGTRHINIKLSASGEQIALVQPFGNSNTFIDSLTFGAQTQNVSVGRYPDGASTFVTFFETTPAASNVLAGNVDCNGVPNGTAALDSCGVCAGGNTGKVPNANKDCNGVCFGAALIDSCGICSGGNTGLVPNANKDACGVCFGNGSSCACVQNEVVSLSLMHIGTAGQIGLMTNGMTINLATIGQFSIRANVCSTPVGSVRFILNGATVRTETTPPYAINGDSPAGSFLAYNIAVGSYSLEARPYSGANGTGTIGISEIISFTVINQQGQTIDCNGVAGGSAAIDQCGVCAGGNTGIIPNANRDCSGTCYGTALLDACGVCSGGTTTHTANSDRDSCGVCFGNGSTCAPQACVQNEVVSFTLMKLGTAGEHGQLINGMTINLAVTGPFSIRANVCSTPVGSVRFIVNGSVVRTETNPPYAINGDSPVGSFTAWNVSPGTYTLVGRPYSGTSGTGTIGVSDTVIFTIINQQGGTPDCNGTPGGTATIDSCGVCSGGNTGVVPNSNKDCNGVCFGTAANDACGICSGGNTGHAANSDKDSCGVCFGNGSTCVPVGCVHNEVVSFSLMRTGTAGEIGLLTNGMVINLATTAPFSVRANVCDSPVGSVRFILNGSVVRTETTPPYAINGDSPTGSFTAWNVAPGAYSLEGRPYSGASGTGTAGVSEIVSFTVISGTAKMSEEIEDKKITEFRLYPNPNNGTFSVEAYNELKADFMLRIYNSLGQVIYESIDKEVSGSFSKSISSDLVLGVYYVEMKWGEQLRRNKILVQ